MRHLDHLSAALRHLRDAEHLAREHSDRSLDQAYHLAGLAPECVRKATLSESEFDRAIGHGVGQDSEAAVVIAQTLDPRAQRYRISGLASRYPSLATWSVDCRYAKTGSYDKDMVTELLEAARDVVDKISLTLWMDGLVPGSFLW